jgi:two-component system sensor histidine kinase KdpD
LATIKAFVTSLLSEQVSWDGAERKELLTAMNEETDHLNRLVGNVLDMSRIESGAMKPNRKWNQLSEIVEAATARLRKELSAYTLIIDTPEELPLVPVDYMQIEQVFTNLLSNSAKYSPTGSSIWVQAQEAIDQNSILVEVVNEGPAVNQEDLDQIFTKFYRVTNSEKVSGTGLGLSICKGIIEAHGGQIWAENLPNAFAFKFTLPLQVEGMAPPIIHREN